MSYANEYDSVLRYAADNATLHYLLSERHLDPDTRRGRGEESKRFGTSDALREHGRDREADLLADPHQHTVIRDGKVYEGAWDHTDLHDALRRVNWDLAGHAHYNIYPSHEPHHFDLVYDPHSNSRVTPTVATSHALDAPHTFSAALLEHLAQHHPDNELARNSADDLAHHPVTEYAPLAPEEYPLP